MRKLLLPFLLLGVSLGAGASAIPPLPTEPPPQPPRRGVPGVSEASVKDYLRTTLSQKVGREAVEAAGRALTSIMVSGVYGEFPLHVPFNVLIRDRMGWQVWTEAGGPNPLPAATGAEIDRILASDAFWREAAGFSAEQPCTGGARVMVIRHRGRERVTRQPCGPSGITGRLGHLAASLRLPSGAQPWPPEPPQESPRELRPGEGREYPIDDPEVSRIIWDKSQASAMAWNRGDLEAYLAPYAEDVTLLWPDRGMEYHKSALRARAVRSQSWQGPPARKMEVHTSTVRQIAPYVVLQTSHIYYSGGGRPDTHSWVTTIWQNRRGTWEVTHEQPAPEAPGHSR
ncbi:MAG TPA: nuclear transport factor 2 family protein [Allosphingosinicella sp.]|uniref:nuclear transport factor 2 family protein n=1 Tax=Allosphingosinicella sp. TaxID=2823234 RepID=UPI002ED7E0BE